MNLELKSEKILKLFDEYRTKLGIGKYSLNAGYDHTKKVFLKVEIEGDFKKLNYSGCKPLILELVSEKEKKPYVRLTGSWGDVNIGFINVNQLKLLTELIDKLLKINIHEFPEYIEFLKLKEQEEIIKEEKQKLDKELELKKQELELKLEKIKNGEINITNEGVDKKKKANGDE